jgi:hypothetical protein
VSATALSKQVNVPQSTLSKWLRQARAGAACVFLNDPNRSPQLENAMTPRRPEDWPAEEKLKTFIKWIFWAAAVLAGVFTMGSESAIGREPAGWDLLQQGGLVVLIRHAAAPGFGDPPHFRLGECTTQRNLCEEGRRQARALGESFRRRKIPSGSFSG